MKKIDMKKEANKLGQILNLETIILSSGVIIAGFAITFTSILIGTILGGYGIIALSLAIIHRIKLKKRYKSYMGQG